MALIQNPPDGKNYIRCFFYRLQHYDGKIEAFKMCIDTNTFLDLWLETKTRVKKIEPLSRDEYYEHIVGRQVQTHPVSNLTHDITHSTTYEVYVYFSANSYVFR